MTTTAVDAVVDEVQELKISAKGAKPDPQQHFNDWPNDTGFDAKVEHHDAIELQVQGSFPPYVNGILMRTGPGAFQFSRKNPKDGYVAAHHWFDGITHVYKFQISSGTSGSTSIKYSSRRQADGVLEHARATGNFMGITFAQKRDPCDSFFKKLKTVWAPTSREGPSQVNIGVAFQKPIHAPAKDGLKNKEHETLTATTDQSRTLEFDLVNLEPFGVTDQTKLHPNLTGELSAAHPCVDPSTQDVFNYNLALGPSPAYRLFRVNAKNGSTDILATITGAEPTYIHSQFLTPNFHILCVWNATIGGRGVKVLWERNILSAIDKFDPNAKTEWIVVDRKGRQGVVARFTGSAFFCFHTVNAFETERPDGKVDVHCELVTHDSLDILHKFYYDHLVSNGPQAGSMGTATRTELKRFTLPGVSIPDSKASKDLTAKKCDISKLPADKAELKSTVGAENAGELPTFNSAYALRQHRYVYAVGDRGISSFVDSIVKADTTTGQSLRWSKQAHTPGEPIFIADPNGKEEDDGVLLTVVLDGLKGSSYLLCLNARDLAEIGRAEVGCAVGLGFHGCFLERS